MKQQKWRVRSNLITFYFLEQVVSNCNSLLFLSCVPNTAYECLLDFCVECCSTQSQQGRPAQAVDHTQEQGPTQSPCRDQGPTQSSCRDQGPTQSSCRHQGPTQPPCRDQGPTQSSCRDQGPTQSSCRDQGPTQPPCRHQGPTQSSCRDQGPTQSSCRDQGPTQSPCRDQGPTQSPCRDQGQGGYVHHIQRFHLFQSYLNPCDQWKSSLPDI
uniref:Uncharacterized protein n=1 Tax=Gadus morhua TaxID=8049 RepID=A0A8C4ZXF3_GADMO